MTSEELEELTDVLDHMASGVEGDQADNLASDCLDAILQLQAENKRLREALKDLQQQCKEAAETKADICPYCLDDLIDKVLEVGDE